MSKRALTTSSSVLAIGVLVFCQAVHAEDYLVHDQEEYSKAHQNLQPGDRLILADGEWRDFEIIFNASGTQDKAITLTAQNKGKVFITGRSNLRIAGDHLLISGLVFKDGYTPTNEVISFRRNKTDLANHTRVTEVVIDHFNNPERFETDFWVIMYGRNNRFDHNYLVGKSTVGVTMAVKLNTEQSQNNHHRIDHNYFGHRPVLGSNGGETLRIGTSKYSLTESHTTIENNFFERCNGEVEIVSNKSGNNIFRGNVFLESRGTLTLRHGNDNLLENNIFLGNGVDHTGGLRVINKRQTVRNNYMSGLTGYRFGGGLVVMNGVPNSSINRYHQVEDSLIEHNTLINVEHIELAAGSDEERSAVPKTTVFRHNLLVNHPMRDSIAVHDDISGISFSDNIADGIAKLPAPDGFLVKPVTLARAANGLEYPTDTTLNTAGVSRDLTVLDRDHTGPSWYAKPDNRPRFDSGMTHVVNPGQDTLTAAVARAGEGDIIELKSGEYTVSKILELDKALTIKGSAQSSQQTMLRFERSTLFELADGGSLKIENLSINGVDAPDAYGNSVIRTSRYSMLTNYELCVNNVQVSNLNTNHSFNFFRISKHTFASNILINDSEFTDVSGHIIALDREIDDLGIYNAEYVTLSDSSFKNIGGSVLNVYRGGTDESTFGPHVSMENNVLESVGNDKRNKTRSSVFLQGVQVATITGNTLRKSEPLRIVQTVGDPITTLAKNQFIATPEPVITSIGPSKK